MKESSGAHREAVISSIDGQIVPPEKATVSIFDNTFLYAQGLFETVLAVGTSVMFETDHLRRLREGSRTIDLRLPVTLKTISRWMRELLATHPARLKKLRLTITAGDSARWLGQAGPSRVIMSVGAVQIPERPFRLLVSPHRVDQQSALRRIKTVSYALQAISMRQAQQAGLDDALLLNERGHLAELTSANIFWVNKGTILTPPLSDGCLDGVMRRHVRDACRKLDLTMTERSSTLGHLGNAEEVFLSSSLKLVTPIGSIRDGRRSFAFAPGPVTARLQQHFLDQLNRLGRRA